MDFHGIYRGCPVWQWHHGQVEPIKKGGHGQCDDISRSAALPSSEAGEAGEALLQMGGWKPPCIELDTYMYVYVCK